jgi:hypothetical protein
MFRPYWVILRQRIYGKELLLHCFASSRWIATNTSHFAPCFRPLFVVGGEPLVLLCVHLVLVALRTAKNKYEFCTENGASGFLQNIGIYLPNYTRYTERVVAVVALWIRIREALGWIPAKTPTIVTQDVGGFPQSLQENFGISRLGYNLLVQNPFQFISHPTIRGFIGLATNSVVK